MYVWVWLEVPCHTQPQGPLRQEAESLTFTSNLISSQQRINHQQTHCPREVLVEPSRAPAEAGLRNRGLKALLKWAGSNELPTPLVTILPPLFKSGMLRDTRVGGLKSFQLTSSMLGLNALPTPGKRITRRYMETRCEAPIPALKYLTRCFSYAPFIP
ncbi:hypothetical protein CIRG_05430 [Coccidioides immitis RMSCC 2394]|uniref:Uncharacterized protein n=1 Tax=Coccidioides immitis RMSCC 2394 TaxID=404692 RepID=A0A0J6YFE2_COCIT|nr:hypothetical protein CIRG_05430 [Coccidioides immitis RMSCC 2394]